MGDYDKKENNKFKKALIDIKSTKFVINWASGAMLLGALIWAITATMQNKSLKGSVSGLKESNKTLTETVKTLESTVNVLQGQNQVTNQIIQQFVENPPAVITNKVDELAKKIEQYHGTGNNNEPGGSTNRPPSD